MDAYRGSLSGTISAHSTGSPGGDVSISLREDSLAKTSAQRGEERESPESDPVYGLRWPALSVRFDRDMFSWKIAPCLFPGDSMLCSVTLPRWGMMRNGELSERDMPELLTAGIGYGYLPTPTATPYGSCQGGEAGREGQKNRPSLQTMARRNLWPTPTVAGNYNRTGLTEKSGDGLATAVARKGGGESTRRTYPMPMSSAVGPEPPGKTGIVGALNPDWVGWLMAFPIGWTALRPLATARYRAWSRLHGMSLEAKSD
jgi:hypothetical protein